MYWNRNDDDYKPSYSESIQLKVAEILKKMQKSRNSSVTSIANDKAFQDLYKELDALQDSCTHFWEVYLLFTQYKKFCKTCSKEDKAYVHPK